MAVGFLYNGGAPDLQEPFGEALRGEASSGTVFS
jgi:hypothetical protein